MTLLERFLTYVNIPTSSDEHSSTVPTAAKEFVLLSSEQPILPVLMPNHQLIRLSVFCG